LPEYIYLTRDGSGRGCADGEKGLDRVIGELRNSGRDTDAAELDRLVSSIFWSTLYCTAWIFGALGLNGNAFEFSGDRVM